MQPHQLAYDRPSPKLLPFLEKHFGLKTHLPQPNHYVLYYEFFTQKTIGGGKKRVSIVIAGAHLRVADHPSRSSATEMHRNILWCTPSLLSLRYYLITFVAIFSYLSMRFCVTDSSLPDATTGDSAWQSDQK